MKMTKQQENSVKHRGTTLLVAAGAGSGKTSTLSQRIISRISDTQDPAEIDDFLIVTFTNASAADLSEKIERAVSKCVASDLSNKKAMRQLAKIKYANISTISSFCFSVVKKHFQLLDLPAKVKICDETERDLLRRRAILSVIDEKYESAQDGSYFFDAVEMFSGDKNDDKFVDLIFNLHRKIFSFPEPKKWCTQVISKYDEVIDCADYNLTEYGNTGVCALRDSIESYIQSLEIAISKMDGIDEMCSYREKFVSDVENAKNALSLMEGKSYDETREIALLVTKSGLQGLKAKYDPDFKKSVTDMRNNGYKGFQKTLSLFYGADSETVKKAAADCKAILEEIFDVIFRVDVLFGKEKKERGIIDFSDTERFTYKLFVSGIDDDGRIIPSEIAIKYRDSFEEIYIDEYQDINPIQDMIFRAICKYDTEGHELNRFMVGDIKQSIYRFRGARPDLFASYLSKFASLEENNCEHKEFLSDNFRCSESVVDFTNLIFAELLGEEYLKNEKLIYSKHEDVKVDAPCELVFFEKSEETDIYYDDEIKAAAQKILDIVDNESYVGSDGKPYSFSDVAILMPTVRNSSDKYARYFENCGIPAFSDVTDDFFENSEIVLCMCILNTIDNSLRDIYVTGAMRSEVFGFSDEDLLTIRRLCDDVPDTECSMWQSVKSVAESGQSDDSLTQKCISFVEVIEEFKKVSVGTPSDKLILKLYSKLHLMNVVSEKSFNRYSDNAASRRENLMILYNQARMFESTSFRGLSAFLDYLNDRAENSSSGIRSATESAGSNTVKIMSIHSSKGLEFPVCILCGLSGEFNRREERETLITSDDMGIGFKLRDLASMRSSGSSTSIVKYDTPFRNAVKYVESQQLLEEKKRLLYVAMTRAKDRLFVLLKNPDADELEEYYEKSIRKTSDNVSGFRQWFLKCTAKYQNLQPLFANYSIDRREVIFDDKNCFSMSLIKPQAIYKTPAKADEAENSSAVKKALEAIKHRLDFHYPYFPLSQIPSKVSVSDIKNGKLSASSSFAGSDNYALSQPAFMKEVHNDPALAGTAMHEFMQYADYTNCEVSVENEAKRLLECGYITGEQYALLDYEKLNSFFKHTIYLEIKNSTQMYREAPFTLNLKVNELYDITEHELCDETMLVQGKIDCFFRNAAGEYVVLDFKTDKVKNMEELVSRYSLQLEYYKRAVCEMIVNENVHMAIYSFYLNEVIYV